MESTPGDLNNSEKKLHFKVSDDACRQIGTLALHPTYDDHEDAHSANGGTIPPYREPEVEKVYPTGLSETILFAGRRQRDAVDPRHAEIIRVYKLSLDELSSSQFHQLSPKDQLRVAVAGHDVIATTESRARVLRADGNYANPVFQHYGFESQKEANEYAAELVILQHDLRTRRVVNDIELAYRALKSKSRPSTLTVLSRQVRDLTVSIEKDGKVVVKNKPVAR